RPGRLQIGKGVLRETGELRGREIDDEQIRVAADLRGEGNRLAIRRPRWLVNLAEILEGNLPRHTALVGVDDGEQRSSCTDGGDRQFVAVRIPRAGRAQELQAVEVRIRRGLDQGSDDL